jgi:hypothetical protein
MGMCLPQRTQTLAVSIIADDELPVVATLNDVVRVSGNSETGLTGHEFSKTQRILIGI